MSHQPPQTRRSEEHDQREVNRRKFVQTIMASVPAASLACAIPAMAGDVSKPPSESGKAAVWICAISELFTFGDDLTLYLMLNCSTNEFSNFVGTANMDLGKCDDPQAGGCHQLSTYNQYPRTDDEFGWVLSPDLDEAAIQRVKYVCTAMKADASR